MEDLSREAGGVSVVVLFFLLFFDVDLNEASEEEEEEDEDDLSMILNAFLARDVDMFVDIRCEWMLVVPLFP